jgi:hypothetical protein
VSRALERRECNNNIIDIRVEFCEKRCGLCSVGVMLVSSSLKLIVHIAVVGVVVGRVIVNGRVVIVVLVRRWKLLRMSGGKLIEGLR